MSKEVKKGDKLDLSEVPYGGPRTTPDDPESGRQKTHAERIMRDDQDVLRKLAE